MWHEEEEMKGCKRERERRRRRERKKKGGRAGEV